MSKISSSNAFELALEITKILAANPSTHIQLASGNGIVVGEFIEQLTKKLMSIDI